MFCFGFLELIEILKWSLLYSVKKVLGKINKLF